MPNQDSRGQSKKEQILARRREKAKSSTSKASLLRSRKNSSRSGRFSSDDFKGRRLGRVLTKMGKATREQVHECLVAQQKEMRSKGRARKFGEFLIEKNIVTSEEILEALAGQAGITYLSSIDGNSIPSEALKALPRESALQYEMIPIAFNSSTREITVAMKDPEGVRGLDDLQMLLNLKPKAVVGPPEQIDSLLAEKYPGGSSSFSDTLKALENDDALASLEVQSDVSSGDLAKAASSDSIVELLNRVLLMAIQEKASDIHFEPFENEFKLRYRIDGVLYEMMNPPSHIALPIVSRLKVMANLDIAERRLPQDGRIELNVGGKQVDLRVAVLPTMFGESVVMRVLDRSNVSLSLDKIGLRDDEYETVQDLTHKPNGIVLVTGPTGSGKTTTLYACLSELNEPTEKILTAEDPVEYDIDGLVQCQVNAEQELTFASLLRSFLRQDPDTILVGEIRDLETAQIAIQASLTGHLVFSTLHTNDAPSTILRLIDLGVESFLITATIEAIVAQRLVRRICNDCKEEYVPNQEELMELGLTKDTVEGRRFFRGAGCDKCLKSGYKGRLAIFEIMEFDDHLRELVMKQASTAVLREESYKRGMRSLRQSGLRAIYDGQTTIDEVVRETLAAE